MTKEEYSAQRRGGVYYDGNTVRKTDLPGYYPNVRVKSKPNTGKKKTKAQTVKEKKARLRAQLVTVFSIFLVAFAAFCVLYRGVLITDASNRIEKKEKELSDMVATNLKTQMEIDQALDLKTVEEAALGRLGMRQPEKYQTVYVDLDQVDHVELANGQTTEKGSRISSFFGNIKEYLD